MASIPQLVSFDPTAFAGRTVSATLVGVKGLYFSASCERSDLADVGGDVPGLGTADGDMGPESMDDEKTPLLAMLLDPSDPWLDRRGAGAAAKNGENRPLLAMLMLPNDS